jgi:hypothetical protein
MDSIFCIEPGAWITGIDIHTLKRRPIVQVSKEVGMNVLWNTNKSFLMRSQTVYGSYQDMVSN